MNPERTNGKLRHERQTGRSAAVSKTSRSNVDRPIGNAKSSDNAHTAAAAVDDLVNVSRLTL